MKILLFGVGAIGSLMAHYLCEAGNDVTIVARSTYEELNKNGLVIRHHLQRKTTVDHPRVLKEADNEHYDIVFSVMQGQQQIALLPTLTSLNTDLIVLVGNNMETEKCEEILGDIPHLYGFQGSAGHREKGMTVAGRLPVTDLTIGGLYSAASSSDIQKIKKAFNVKGYKVTPVDNMYAYYMYHIAEIMPYCYLCYRLDCNLKNATKSDIQMIMDATKECFDYLKEQDIPVMPEGEDAFYDGGSKTTSMRLLYSVMSKTILGKLMVSDHCENGIREMRYLDAKFDTYRKENPGNAMPVWDKMRQWALPVFEIADSYEPQKGDDAKSRSREYFNKHKNSRLARDGYWRHDYRFAMDVIKRINPDRLIDIGCGPGAFLEEVSKKFPDIQLNALDLSEEMIEKTRSRLPQNAIVTIGDSENMPLDDEQYKVVTCNLSLHHYPHPQKAVNEMYRILQKGGYLILNDLDCISPIRNVTNYFFPKMKTGDVKMYKKEEILKLVNEAGFKKVKYRKISPFTFQCVAKK